LGTTRFTYDRETQRRPKLGEWTAELVAGGTSPPAREELTLIRLFEELRGRGYLDGYDAVRWYARTEADGAGPRDGDRPRAAELRAERSPSGRLSHEAVELLESCGSAPQKGRPLRGAARRPRTRRDDVQVRSDAGRSERIPGLMEISE